jgi:hypothetical protein
LATNRSPRHRPVLAAVSRGCPGAQGRFPRVTHPSATRCHPEGCHPVRLACVRRAASVRSEPGSNSQLHPAPARRRASIQTTPTPQGHRRSSELQPAPAGGRSGIVSEPSLKGHADRIPKTAPPHRRRRLQDPPLPKMPKPAAPPRTAARASLPLHHNVKYQSQPSVGQRKAVYSAVCRAPQGLFCPNFRGSFCKLAV